MPERLKKLEPTLSSKSRNIALRLHGVLPKRQSFPALILALALLIVFTPLKPLADAWAGGRLPPFIFFYPMVVLGALLAGARAGIVLATSSVLVAWVLYIPPTLSFSVADESAIISLAIYLLSAAFLAIVVGFARYTLDLAVANEQLRDYDAQEAVHRIKNLLSVVQSLTVGTLREASSLDEYRELILRRIEALSSAQDVLRKSDDTPVSGREMIQAALGPFLPNSKITMRCESGLLVPAQYVHGLTLALFELATNSAKYGALSSAGGEITLSCESRENVCAVRWTETPEHQEFRSHDVSQVSADEGFGSRLIKVALRRDPRTEVRLDQSETGISAIFSWPRVTAA